MKYMSVIAIALIFLCSCKTWEGFKSDSSEMAEKTEEQTKEVIKGTKKASKKAVNKMQDAFGDE